MMELVHVVIDTNVVAPDYCDTFISARCLQTIRQYQWSGAISLRWYVPEMVCHERENQLRQLLRGQIEKSQGAARMLKVDHSFSPTNIEVAIKEHIDDELHSHGIRRIQCDSEKVDWPGLMRAAALREPPFLSGDGEKGFKDRIILETVSQFQEQMNLTHTGFICFISGDKILRDSVMSLIESPRLAVHESLEAFRSWINAKEAELEPTLISMLPPLAKSYFYVANDTSTLWYTENCEAHIKEQYDLNWGGVTGMSHISFEDRGISDPEFLSRSGERMRFQSVHRMHIDEIRYISALAPSLAPPPPPEDSTIVETVTPAVFAALFGISSPPANVAGYFVRMPKVDLETRIQWSATLAESAILTDGTVDHLDLEAWDFA